MSPTSVLFSLFFPQGNPSRHKLVLLPRLPVVICMFPASLKARFWLQSSKISRRPPSGVVVRLTEQTFSGSVKLGALRWTRLPGNGVPRSSAVRTSIMEPWSKEISIRPHVTFFGRQSGKKSVIFKGSVLTTQNPLPCFFRSVEQTRNRISFTLFIFLLH